MLAYNFSLSFSGLSSGHTGGLALGARWKAPTDLILWFYLLRAKALYWSLRPNFGLQFAVSMADELL